MSEWQAGAKRIVITQDGNHVWSVRRETWDVMPGIAPAPYYAWDEDEGTWMRTMRVERALKHARDLMTNGV